MRSRRITLKYSWWRGDVEPFLLLAGDDRKPVAVLPSGLRGHYDLFDPAMGHRTRLDERTASVLSGEALVFSTPFPVRSLTARDVGGNALRWNGSDVAAAIGLTVMGGCWRWRSRLRPA
jgi:hypothetical protein